jgi:equilibrative nucleoside transporter 1/2/3
MKDRSIQELPYVPIDTPKDNWHFVWFGCMMLGVGVLLPWNALISAVDYFIEMLCSGLSHDACSADTKAQQFAFYLSIAYNIPSLPLLILSTLYASRISFKARIVFCFVGEFLVFVAVCVIVVLSPPITSNAQLLPSTSFWLLLVCCFISGCFSALLFGAILSFTSKFAAHYTTAVMSGNGIAGIIAGLLRVVTKISLPATAEGDKTSSLIFFGITTFVFVICIVIFLFMLKNPFTIFHLLDQDEKSGMTKTDDIMIDEEERSKSVSVLRVQKKIWVQSLTVFMVFFITLSLFPGMIYAICPQSGTTITADWFGILLIGLFQFFDFVGRTLPRFTLLGLNKRILCWPVFARALFFVVFILCIHPRVFSANWWPCIWMVLFATSNGFTGTLAMMFGPSVVEDHERPTAGYLMSLYLNSGIFAGVLFALVVNNLVDAPPCQ